MLSLVAAESFSGRTWAEVGRKSEVSIKMSLTPRKFTGGVEGARRISSGVAVVLVLSRSVG